MTIRLRSRRQKHNPHESSQRLGGGLRTVATTRCEQWRVDKRECLCKPSDRYHIPFIKGKIHMSIVAYSSNKRLKTEYFERFGVVAQRAVESTSVIVISLCDCSMRTRMFSQAFKPRKR